MSYKMRKNTLQQQIILETLEEADSHPTAEEIYSKIAKKYPHISLATVYRNLNKLSEDGKILRIDLCGVSHYDKKIVPHLHFFCTRCKKIYDIDDEIVSRIITGLKEFLSMKNFEVYDAQLIFKGICDKCKRGDINE